MNNIYIGNTAGEDYESRALCEHNVHQKSSLKLGIRITANSTNWFHSFTGGHRSNIPYNVHGKRNSCLTCTHSQFLNECMSELKNKVHLVETVRIQQ